MSLPEILAEVAHYEVAHVCVTGGEPLAQPACLRLLSELCDAGYAVSLETSGALDIGGIDARVKRIVDLKAPGSGEFARNRWQNLALLTADDELKFVLKDRIRLRVGAPTGRRSSARRGLPVALLAGCRRTGSGDAG
jgi:7-carboxy-7-deazaguanine synthase